MVQAAEQIRQEMTLDLKLAQQKADRRKRIVTGMARPAACHYCGTGGLWAMNNAAGSEILCDEWGAMHLLECARARGEETCEQKHWK